MSSALGFESLPGRDPSLFVCRPHPYATFCPTHSTEFKKAVLKIEDTYEGLKLCHDHWKQYNPIVTYAKFGAGILGGILSVLWLLHIVLYMLIRDPYPDVRVQPLGGSRLLCLESSSRHAFVTCTVL